MKFVVGLLMAIVITLLLYTDRPDVGAAVGPASFRTHHDTIPNFAHNPTIRSLQHGAWSSASTWNPARLPGDSDVVLIQHAVTYDSTAGTADVIGIDVGGTLRFVNDRATRLTVATLRAPSPL